MTITGSWEQVLRLTSHARDVGRVVVNPAFQCRLLACKADFARRLRRRRFNSGLEPYLGSGNQLCNVGGTRKSASSNTFIFARPMVLIQKNADQYDPSDLLQNWKNGAEYIFLESKDDVDELKSFMKANEMDGAKSVHFVFANSPPEGPQTSNHIAINVSGFYNGFDAFQMACASSQ